ncbi:Alpha-actinin-like protein 1 [Fusarium odoratissimum]|uniref:Alpha-actinin-like protein 1 n=1 Tax=Fusarium oxysporum f. sp. cubense (strain race 4) TaxID=2502994 RepID=N1RP00_FUSC4|nr:Alpha-actinin-like protein 1 [Fusarium odoratissimum]
MDATKDSAQAFQGMLPLQPGNVEGNEKFPNFCLHADAQSSDDCDCNQQHRYQENKEGYYVYQTDLSINNNSNQHHQHFHNSPSASISASSRLSYISTVSASASSSSSRISTASFESLPITPISVFEASPHTPRSLSNRLSSPVTGFIARRRAFTQDSCSLSYSPPSSPTPRTRRDKSQLHAARVQRSGSRTTNTTFLLGLQIGKQSTNSRRFPPSASTPADALAAVEPPHDQKLTRMAFAEQQRWVTVQQKTFTKWLNTKIEARNLEVKDLVKDLSDGVMLIHLLECLSHESLGRYASKPKLRVQKFENANLALDFVKSRGIQMTNIGAEDVVDGNQKIVLGLIWTLILRFTISDINEEGMSAKEGLLLWCQRKTACYDEVEVRDFSASWNDGLAFCALLDIHRPDLIDYDALDKKDHRGNMQLAFDIAHKEIGIPKLLDVEDVCDVAKPDERSLMTYIAYWFHAFSQMEKVENAGRRVEKFVNNMQGAWEMQSAYERRMRALLQAIQEQIEVWKQATFEGTYADAKAQSNQFFEYKKGKKRQWVAEKSDLATLLGNIKTKLGTYRLRPYDPPAELSLDALERKWAELASNEMTRAQLINETIRDIKNALRKSFADKANDFAMALNTMQLAISGLDGDVEDQLHHELEFSAALASLGLVFSEDEMHDYFLETSGGRDYVTFEQFIRFMVDVTEDQNTAEQVFQSFREVADGKPYVTEMDLRHSLVPDEVIDQLIEIMPPHSGPDMSEDRGMPQYDYISFMEKLINDQNNQQENPEATQQNRSDAEPQSPHTNGV